MATTPSLAPIAIAMGPRVRLCYNYPEVTRGVLNGTPTYQVLRAIDRDIDTEIKGLMSAEVSVDRQIHDYRNGSVSIAGNLGFELSLATAASDHASVTHVGMDDMFESLLGGSWSAVGTAGGSAGTLKVGTNLNSFSVERQFLDIGAYEGYQGVIAGDMTLDFKPESIVGGKLTLLGMGPGTSSNASLQTSGQPTTATAAPPFDTFIGSLSEGGTTNAVATAISLSIKSGRALSPVIGSKFSPDIFDGQCVITGTFSGYFGSSALLAKFLNETPSAVIIQLNELGFASSNRKMVITLPNIKYTQNKKSPKQMGGVVQDMAFQALYDPTSGTTMQIDRYL